MCDGPTPPPVSTSNDSKADRLPWMLPPLTYNSLSTPTETLPRTVTPFRVHSAPLGTTTLPQAGPPFTTPVQVNVGEGFPADADPAVSAATANSAETSKRPADLRFNMLPLPSEMTRTTSGTLAACLGLSRG